MHPVPIAARAAVLVLVTAPGATLILAGATAAQEFPVVGGYGFDWLKPATTQCRRITQAEAATFRSCRFSPAGQAFGLPSPHHTCVAPGRSEILIYASPGQCAEAFETMQANGP